jgi:hypothetical protein
MLSAVVSHPPPPTPTVLVLSRAEKPATNGTHSHLITPYIVSRVLFQQVVQCTLPTETVGDVRADSSHLLFAVRVKYLMA